MIHPATRDTHGPRRKVVGMKDYFDHAGRRYDQEVLECGHPGEVMFQWKRPGKWRHCWPCRWQELQAEREEG
jgi:hypothetical protein